MVSRSPTKRANARHSLAHPMLTQAFRNITTATPSRAEGVETCVLFPRHVEKTEGSLGKIWRRQRFPQLPLPQDLEPLHPSAHIFPRLSDRKRVATCDNLSREWCELRIKTSAQTPGAVGGTDDTGISICQSRIPIFLEHSNSAACIFAFGRQSQTSGTCMQERFDESLSWATALGHSWLTVPRWRRRLSQET